MDSIYAYRLYINSRYLLKPSSPKDFLIAFTCIPLETTTLDLRGNDLSNKTGEELAFAFAAIPEHVKTLDLGANSLYKKTAGELTTIFAAIPEQVETLDLGGNDFGKITEELITVFAAIPKQLKTLDLSNNHLWNKTAKELATAFARIPEQVKTLDLSDNNLLVESLPMLRSKLRRCVKSESQLYYEVDYLLSGACYSGTEALKQIALKLLYSLKLQNKADVHNNFTRLIAQIDSVLAYYEELKPFLESQNDFYFNRNRD